MEAQNIRRSSSQFSAKNKKSVRLIENALTSDNNMWVTMIPDVLKYIFEFLSPYKYLMRLICKKFANILPKKCLSKKHTFVLVRELEKLFQMNLPLPFDMRLMCQAYHCLHYWPPEVITLDLNEWQDFFDTATELRDFNWRFLLDDHCGKQRLPTLFHRDNIYAFCALGTLKSLYVSDRHIKMVEKLLQIICGKKPNFRMLVHQHGNLYKVNFNIKSDGKKWNIFAEGTSVRECLRSFYGKLLLFITKYHMSYYEIASEIHRKYPYDWYGELGKLVFHVPYEEKPIFVYVTHLPKKGHEFYVQINVGPLQFISKGKTKAKAVQNTSKAVVPYVEQYTFKLMHPPKWKYICRAMNCVCCLEDTDDM